MPLKALFLVFDDPTYIACSLGTFKKPWITLLHFTEGLNNSSSRVNIDGTSYLRK